MKTDRPVKDAVVDPALVEAVDDAVIDLTDVEPGRADGVLGHDPADFSSFYLRYRVPLCKRASRFLSDARDVDEVVQETFLKVFLALPELDTELAAVRFAHRVLANMCIDRYRSEVRRPGLLDLDLVAANLADDLPEDPLVRAEDAAIVRDALSKLTPEYRAALIKREIEEKSLAVIADEIGIAQDQVKHLLFRARRALRRILVGSSVDPDVDLSAGEVIDLAGRRVVAAAGSNLIRGTAVILLLIAASAWMLGAGWAFPAGHGSSHGVIANSGPQIGIVPPPSGVPSPTSGSHRPAHHASTARHGTVSHHAPSTPYGATHHHGATGPGGGPSSGNPRPGGGNGTPTVGTAPTVPPTTPPTSPPPTGPPPPTFAVRGLVNSSHAQVQNQSRVVEGNNAYESSSSFVARTASGLFQMNQVLDFTTAGGNLSSISASLNPVVPAGGSSAGYVTGQPSVTVEQTGSGYHVLVSGTATSLSTNDPDDQLLVTLDATYDSTLTEVTAEQVTVIAAVTSPAPTPSASASPGPTGSGALVTSGQILGVTRLEQ